MTPSVLDIRHDEGAASVIFRVCVPARDVVVLPHGIATGAA